MTHGYEWFLDYDFVDLDFDYDFTYDDYDTDYGELEYDEITGWDDYFGL